LNAEEFVRGGFDTGMLPRNEQDLLNASADVDETAAVAAVAVMYRDAVSQDVAGRSSVEFDKWSLAGFRLNARPARIIKLRSHVDDRQWAVTLVRDEDVFECAVTESHGDDSRSASRTLLNLLSIRSADDESGAVCMTLQAGAGSDRESATVTINQNEIIVHRSAHKRYPGDQNARFQIASESHLGLNNIAAHAGSLLATSPMPGRIVRLLVEEGSRVYKGDVLFEVEAMKMMHAIKAGSDGIVFKCSGKQGDLVDTELVVVELRAEDEAKR
jgi:biotin carboxyl carrier protein